ncbi:MAG: hypothetical protein ACI3X4_02680 [Bacteroidaceae bacterium]
MKRNVFFMAVLMMVSLAFGSAFAQGRRHDVRDGRPAGRSEMALRDVPRRGYHMGEPGMRDGRHGHMGRPDMMPCHRPEPPRYHMPHHGGPRLDACGYVPGWHGRVRYVDGRWGYLRGRDWYWYDVYYEPEFYFSHPVAHFHGHLSPAGKVVAGAVGAAAVGAFIGALCR